MRNMIHDLMERLAPLSLAVLLVVLSIGCSQVRDDSIDGDADGVIEIVETTNVVITDHQVAVGNIWERELPDTDGNVAMRMSASLSIMCNETGEEWNEFVIEGDLIDLNENTYEVRSIDPGDNSRGLLTLVEVER